MNPGTPPNQQANTSYGGNVYANQAGGTFKITNNNGPQATKGPRTDTKVLLAVLPLNAIFFLYGMVSYSGHNTSADTWRAGLFLLLLLITGGMIGRWIRRRV